MGIGWLAIQSFRGHSKAKRVSRLLLWSLHLAAFFNQSNFGKKESLYELDD